MLPRLMYISQGSNAAEHIAATERAIHAGVRLVQLRMKNTPADIILETAVKAKALCERDGATLIINDHPQIAAEMGCWVHLGLNDAPVSLAKELGVKHIGGTANTFDDIMKRCREGVDYIGLGPYRFTSTKKNLSPVLGADGYRNIISKMRAAGLNTPVFAIGGITNNDIAELRATGVYGVAISSWLHADDIDRKVNLLNEMLNA